MSHSAKLSSKSQITIPAWVRRKLGIGPGMRVGLQVEGDRLVVQKIEAGIEQLEGALRGVYGDPQPYVDDLRGEWAGRPQ